VTSNDVEHLQNSEFGYDSKNDGQHIIVLIVIALHVIYVMESFAAAEMIS